MHDVAIASRVQHNLRRLMVLVLLGDIVMLAASIVVAWDLRLTIDVWSRSLSTSLALVGTAGPWLLVAWIVILAAQGAYSTREFGSGPEEFRRVFQASIITAGSVGMFCYLGQVSLSRGFVLLVFLVGTPMLLAERYLARKVLHQMRVRGHLVRRVVAVGGPSGIGEIVSVLKREKHAGYEIVGACVPEGIISNDASYDVPVLGRVSEARSICAEVGADAVLVARGGYASSGELRRIAWDLEGSDIELIVVPSLTDVAGPRIAMRPVAGLPLLHVDQPQAGEAIGFSKRLFDIVLAGFALLVLSPLMLAVAFAVWHHDRGPVFFRQPRVGRDGTTFGMMKFRSMVVDAERKLDEIRHLNESDGVLFKIRQDPRITPVGRFLRKYSIDELPQLLNVLKGEMSVVGPRPPLPAEVDTYESHVHRRLLVRPGMTGLWQVSGRSGLSWDESVRLDLYYVDNWSMTTDLVIMAKTVKAVLAPDGAY